MVDKGFVISEQSGSLSPDSVYKSDVEGIDIISRLQVGPDNDQVVSYVHTTDFIGDIHSYFQSIVEKDYDLLVNTIKSLKKQIEYSGYYSAFLIGSLSEEDFEEISERYVLEYKDDIDPIELKRQVLRLLELTGEDFNGQELSDIFGCDDLMLNNIL